MIKDSVYGSTLVPEELTEAKRKVIEAASTKNSPRTYPKDPSDMNEIITCSCGEKEYNGLMYWRDARQYCRRCIHTIWRGDGYRGATFEHYFPARPTFTK